jgi:CRP-like cAMP-binding protein
MNKLQRYLQSLTNISDQTVNAITESGVNQSVKANSIIFQPDKPFLKLLFLENGLLRAYRIIDGKDVTFFFFTPGEFAVDYESFLTESKSQLFFESLVDVNYTVFTKSRIKALYDLYPAFERVGRIMAEKAYLSATMRLKEFQAESLEERYLKLLNHNPALFQQVPQYHIASYLGVSPQSLSRVRAKLQNKNY